MRARESGVIIKIREYGENSAIVKILFETIGFQHGFVRAAKSKANNFVLQPGNLIACDHFLRSEDGLRSLTNLDLVEGFVGKIILDKTALTCLRSALSLLDQFFLEGQSQKILYLQLLCLLEFLVNYSSNFFVSGFDGDGKKAGQSQMKMLAAYVKFELEILQDLGYGLDFSCCAATGAKSDLKFVSPKSARAVSVEGAKGYESFLLPLPEFLLTENTILNSSQILSGIRLAGFFLQKFLFSEKNPKQISFLQKTRLGLEGLVSF
jgi:DNA repair protein RecO (recombination protein O)